MTVRESPPLRLHVTATTPDDQHRRWGFDEPDGAYIPGGLRFSSTMPGGFESMDCQLRRQPGRDWPDLERLSTLRVLGAGGDIAGEYRLERAPASTGDTISIDPSAVGWQAELEDNKTAVIIYRDIDLSRWTGMSVQRKIGLLPTTSIADAAVEPDATTGNPGLKVALTGQWSRYTVCEGLYDARGARIARIWYAWKRAETIDPADPSWAWFVTAANSDTDPTYEQTSNLRAAGPGTGQLVCGTPRRFAGVQLGNTGAVTGDDGVEYPVWFTTLAVYGNHQVPIRGAEPDAGVYASDVIRDIITRFTDLTPQITDSSFIIPQLAFPEPTTPAEMIRQASRFELADWGVWENRTFRWNPARTPNRNWRTRTRPAQLSETGPQIDRVWNSIMVQFQDTDGSNRTVGPPGSGADIETPDLRDDDPENPANKAGIIRRDLLSMGTSTAAGATRVGQVFLDEARQLDHSGQAQAVGHIEDDRGVIHPAWRMRAGDTLSIIDAADPTPRRIVKADYSHDNRTCSVDLDAPPEGLDALLERLGASIVSLGFN